MNPTPSSNDVFSDGFESKLDPYFKADYEKKHRRPEKPRFNALFLGRGMMPPVRNLNEERQRRRSGKTL